jgi:hypothetical protein
MSTIPNFCPAIFQPLKIKYKFCACVWCDFLNYCTECTAKTLYRKFETNIPRNETARPHSEFLHSCFSERFIYSRAIGLPILLQENRWTDRGNI